MKHDDLSTPAKQTFQVVALSATILVVAIHYQSAAPKSPDCAVANWNELSQEFICNGIARVAVPLFAFAAGLFFFRGHDGSSAVQERKLKDRCRSVAMPYFIIASIATSAWLMVRRLESDPVQIDSYQLLSTWLLRPPAEQLWFLRDLMVLVLIAPVIRKLTRRFGVIYLGVLSFAWIGNMQLFPQLASWHVLHTETWLFFSLGCYAVGKERRISAMGEIPNRTLLALTIGWFALIVARIIIRPDFDLWYTDDYDAISLVLFRAATCIGCCVVFVVCQRLRSPWLIQLSGTAFFVYLVHEFPLRAAVERIFDRLDLHEASFWIATPIVSLGCISVAVLLNRMAPAALSTLTGGRTPDRANRVSGGIRSQGVTG